MVYVFIAGKPHPPTFHKVQHSRPLPGLRGQCFKDSGHRLLPHHKDFKHSNSIRTCLRYCRASGFLFMGVQYRHQCFCGNDRPPRSKLAARSSCNHRCSGDKSETCGGDWRLNVYSTKLLSGLAQITI